MVSAYRFLSAMAAAEAGTVADARAHAGMALERPDGDAGASVSANSCRLGSASSRRSAATGLIAGRPRRCRDRRPAAPAGVEQNLYGMVVEAMTNAASYAQASTTDVDLRVVRGRLVIAVRDDSIGFEPTRPTARRDRAQSRAAGWPAGPLARRSAGISSRPGHGTTVRISIPLERHRATQPVSAEPAGPTRGVD